MRRKPLPSPPDEMEVLREARDVLPLVPGSEDDCCTRLSGRLDLPGRDVAGSWLTLLVALGLAEEGRRGFSRVRDGPTDRDALADAFLHGVYGAREVHEALVSADGPIVDEEAFGRIREVVPAWERQKHGADWEAVWRERTADLLDWLVLLGLAERANGGYRAPPTD